MCSHAEKREGGGGGGVVAAVVVSVAGGGREGVEVDAPEALSFGVVRPRRRLLRGVVSEVFFLARRRPFPEALDPATGAYTRPLFSST